jgi:hypothetical protein
VGTTAVRPRRFTLCDAMVLVAAVGLGLMLSRTWSYYAEKLTGPLKHLAAVGHPWLPSMIYNIIALWPVVAMVAPALLLLRLRQPRPPARRLFAPPGVAACMVATVIMALECVEDSLYSIAFTLAYHEPGAPFPESAATTLALSATGAFLTTRVSYGIAAAWVAIAIARRWRAEPSWIDRAGRVVGCLWLLLIPIRFYFSLNHVTL